MAGYHSGSVARHDARPAEAGRAQETSACLRAVNRRVRVLPDLSRICLRSVHAARWAGILPALRRADRRLGPARNSIGLDEAEPGARPTESGPSPSIDPSAIPPIRA